MRHRHPSFVVLASLLVVVACDARVVPTPAPTATAGATVAPSPEAVSPWQVADIVQPAAVTQAPSLPAGYHCSPCHPAEAGQLFGVGRTGDGWLAVGVQQPPARAIALASADGRHWTAEPGFAPAVGTTGIALTTGGGRTVVVGTNAAGATAWVRDGPGRWTEAADQESLHGPASGTAMTSIVAVDGGFVAAGYHDDPAQATSQGAVWRSTDGLTWRLERDPDGVFDGGRIWGLAARGGTLVAVGTRGDPTYGPAAAWVSSGGGAWRRSSLPSDGAGALRAVVATDDGFVAVGHGADDRGAGVWRSDDGLTWVAVDDQPAFHYAANPVRMFAVAAGADGLVAGGWRSDAGNGSAVTWTSRDGLAWEQQAWSPTFSGGQMVGVSAAAGLAVGVGRTGYPDNNQATAWAAALP